MNNTRSIKHAVCYYTMQTMMHMYNVRINSNEHDWLVGSFAYAGLVA